MTLVYNETQKKAKNMQSKKMIGNVRNKFATIFRRSVLFMRNIAFCFPFDACLLFLQRCFCCCYGWCWAAFKCIFLGVQLPSEKERFHVFVCRVNFVCHCFAMYIVYIGSFTLFLSLLASVSFTESLIAFVPLMGKKAQQTTSHWLIPLSFMHI